MQASIPVWNCPTFIRVKMWAWNARCQTSRIRRPNSHLLTQTRSITAGSASGRPSSLVITNGLRPRRSHTIHSPIHTPSHRLENAAAEIFGVMWTG